MCSRYALLPALLFGFLAAAADVPMTKIAVRVVAPDGKAVDGAQVLVRFVKGPGKPMKMVRTAWAGSTNEQGVAATDPLPQGSIEVKVNARGYRPFVQTYEVQEPEKTVAVKMDPGVALSELTVRISNKEGDPLPGAAVELRFVKGSAAVDPGQQHTSWDLHTNDDGMAKMKDTPEQAVIMPQGKIAVQVTYGGYKRFEQTYDVNEPEKTIAVKMEPDVTLAKLTVLVTTMGGKPLDHADVVVKFVKGRSVIKLGKKITTSWEMRTNQEGIAKVPEIPQGTILVQVIAKGYQTFGQTFELDAPIKTFEVKLQSPQEQYSAH